MYTNAINVISVAKCRYKTGTSIPGHTHDFFHIFYIVDGCGELLTGDTWHMLRPDHMIICRPGYRHELLPLKTVLKTIEVKFLIEDDTLYSDVIAASEYVDCSDRESRSFLENALVEANNKKCIYRDVINANVSMLLFKLIQADISSDGYTYISGADFKNEDTVKIRFDFGVLFRYIDNNLGTQITLDTLSEIIGLNPAYLCKIFKREYGISPIKYINNLRIKKAKELMSQADLSITQIAEAVGFNTIHYFSRYFKEKEKISPLEYKLSLNNNVYVYLDKKSLEEIQC